MDKIYKPIDDAAIARLNYIFSGISLPPGDGFSEAEKQGRLLERANMEIKLAAEAEKLAWLDRALFE